MEVSTEKNAKGKTRQRKPGTHSFDLIEVDTLPAPILKKRFKIGRPRKYATPQDLIDRAQEYLDSCYDENGVLVYPITITGMCNYLGITRDDLLTYETGNLVSLMADKGDADAFRDTVKRIKAVCHEFVETHGYLARNPAFAIFCLKNYGWSDTLKIEQTVSVMHALDQATLAVVEGYIKSLEQRIMSDDDGLEVIDVIPEPVRMPMLVPASGK